MELGKLEGHMQKDKTRHLSYINIQMSTQNRLMT